MEQEPLLTVVHRKLIPKRLPHAFAILLTLISLVIIYEVHRKRNDYDNVFEFSTLSEEEIAIVKKSYHEQELLMRDGADWKDLESIRLSNADTLPSRMYEELSADQLCQSSLTRCVAPFMKMQTNIVVSPNHRLVTCLVQKNMSTLMLSIICYLLREREFVSMGREILKEKRPTSFCEHKNLFDGVDAMFRFLQVKNSSEWSLTMVTREPADRFLSGFIDRCLRVGKDCYGCGSNMTCFLQQTYLRTAKYTKRASTDHHDFMMPNTTVVDNHIFPQNWRCDLEKYYHDYEFIRYSSDPSSHLLKDLTRVMRSRKVSESSIDYITKSLRSGRTAHSTVTSEARKILEHRLRSSPYLMELLVRIFYYDFKLFGYPLPDLNSIQPSQLSTDALHTP